MAEIIKTSNELIDLKKNVAIEAFMFPTMRYLHAKERGNENDLMFLGPDALGDTVCMLPAIEFALQMKGMKVSVATKWVELFGGMKLANLVDLNYEPIPDEEEFYCIKAYPWVDELAGDFISSFSTHLVDFISLNLLKVQLPVADRDIRIFGLNDGHIPAEIVIHPGASWPSKTFPKAWWDEVISLLVAAGHQPYIVGRSGIIDKAGQLKGTVDVDATGCFDLRDKLSTLELAWHLQRAKVVLTNDSAPVHIAASGSAWIGMLATVLRADYITHWRRNENCKNEFGWRTENLSLGGIWSENSVQPNVKDYVYDTASGARLEKWLPKPKVVAEWTLRKLGL